MNNLLHPLNGPVTRFAHICEKIIREKALNVLNNQNKLILVELLDQQVQAQRSCIKKELGSFPHCFNI